MATWLTLQRTPGSTDLSLEQSLIQGTVLNASKVAILDGVSLAPVAYAAPDADGAWEAYAKPGSYYIAAFADGCQPLLHGPFNLT